ncbi:WxL domain-containing protein [Enterococcus faecalis]|uniref:WxL domain-containing protein n=1 Tax=Enterococcus faecalis TaxID=1351 RepID=UPI003CC58C21
MKKISLVVAGLATIGVLGLGQSAHAEETTAQVKVNSGGIKISKTSNITFEDVTVKKGGSTAKETNKSSITIEDLRGSSSKGWTLTAKLKDKNFEGMALNVAPNIESNNTVAKPGAAANLNSTAQTIATVADADIKTTEFDTNVSLNAKLTVPEKQLANTYTTTIVWNLAEGPGTK